MSELEQSKSEYNHDQWKVYREMRENDVQDHAFTGGGKKKGNKLYAYTPGRHSTIP